MDHTTYLNYTARGYHIQRAVYTPHEVAERVAHYMAINAAGPHPGDFAGVPRIQATAHPDPLAKYPRLIQMHHWDRLSAEWMIEPRLTSIVASLMGQPPKPIQTMVYFKPPGSRGQSFHQDNLYLRTTPLMAAWVALDGCDADNGAMEMVSGSHLLGLLPCRTADTDLSFTDSETVFPEYLHRELITLDPGDVVFFGGLTVHGSTPNLTSDRFRRAFIVHYEGVNPLPIVGPPLPGAEAK